MKHPDISPLARALASLILCASPASAAVLYSTGFEQPTFADGSTLLGQDGWSTAIPPFLNPGAAVVASGLAHTGTQSLRVAGTDLVPAPEVSPLAVVGSYRRPVNYDSTTGHSTVLITSDVRLDGPTLGSGDFFAANIAARSGDGGIGEISISSDGKVYAYTGNFDGVTLASSTITLGAWHNLGILVDFNADTYSFLVDGTSLGTFPFSAGFTSNTLVRGAAVVYGFPDSGDPASQARKELFTARYDNFSIATVPEPGSAATLLFSALTLLTVVRRFPGIA
jgi:hypothetical protein